MTKLHAQSNLKFTEEQLISLIQQHLNDAYKAKFEFKVFTDVDKFREALRQYDERRHKKLAPKNKDRDKTRALLTLARDDSAPADSGDSEQEENESRTTK